MSITIKIEDFNSWSEIFMEIKRQTNLKTFALIAPDTANVDRQGTKPRSLSHSKMDQERTSKKGSEREAIPRKRRNSAPCPIDTGLLQLRRDPRLTAAARKMSDEELALLYEDIFKPLDVYSILLQRKAQMNVLEDSVFQ